jgi:hypothetical protein
MQCRTCSLPLFTILTASRSCRSRCCASSTPGSGPRLRAGPKRRSGSVRGVQSRTRTLPMMVMPRRMRRRAGPAAPLCQEVRADGHSQPVTVCEGLCGSPEGCSASLQSRRAEPADTQPSRPAARQPAQDRDITEPCGVLPRLRAWCRSRRRSIPSCRTHAAGLRGSGAPRPAASPGWC